MSGPVPQGGGVSEGASDKPSLCNGVLSLLPGRLCSVTALADKLGEDRRRVSETLESLAHTLQRHEERSLEAVLTYLLGLQRMGLIRLVACIISRKYDETKLKVRMAWPAQEEQLEVESGAKTFVMERAFTYLVQDLGATGGQRYLRLRMPLTSGARVAKSMTAACTKALLETCLGSKALIHKMMVACEHVVETVCTDEFPSNTAAERIRNVELRDGGVAPMLLHLSCDVHKVSTCAKGVYDLNPKLISQLLQFGKFCQLPGHMAAFRMSVRRILSDKMQRLLDGEADTRAQTHRELIINTFLTAQDPKTVAARHCCGRFFNGDWESEAIVHYCRSGCCQSQAQTAQRAWKLVLKPLLGRKFRVFPRNNFLGHEQTLDQIGFVMSLHHLCRRACVDAFGFALHATASESYMEDVDLGDEGDESVQDMDEISAWRRATNAARSASISLLSNPATPQDILTTRIVMEPQVSLMRCALGKQPRLGKCCPSPPL